MVGVASGGFFILFPLVSRKAAFGISVGFLWGRGE